MRIRFLQFIVLLLLPMLGVAKPAHITGFRVTEQDKPHATRIVFELDQKTPYHYFGLRNPHRLVVDLITTQARVNLRKAKLDGTVVKRIRTAKKKKGTYRIVFDLNQEVLLKSFTLGPKGIYKKRIIFDLYHSKKKTVTIPKKPVMTAAKKSTLRPVVVVIDPGHGGKDPGATGPHGVHEKDVVLAISKDLAQDLKNQKGIKVFLTRKGDYYITLRQRLRLARRYKADIFVAIHADAYKNKYSKGVSVYALSLRGASSEAARWLAAKENYSELGGVDLKDKNSVLRSVLINLSQTATITASLQLGTNVLDQLNHFTKLHHGAVEQAPFVVLKSPDIPSVLIETGFLSNPKEEHLLKSPRYQHRLAKAIMNGVYRYFYQRPPPGTIIAWQVLHHKVRART